MRNLECAEFKVISITGDGASQNRKFFRMHKLACSCVLNLDSKEPKKITHKVRDPLHQGRSVLVLFCGCSSSHKNYENCWSNSFGHSYTQAMWLRKQNLGIVKYYNYLTIKIRDQYISWDHIRRLYKCRPGSGFTFTLDTSTLIHIHVWELTWQHR